MYRALGLSVMCAQILLLGSYTSALAAQEGSTSPVDPGAMVGMAIVGFDPDTGDLGVAVASSFPAIGPFAATVRSDVGAVVMMGGAPPDLGERVLDWIEAGLSPEEVVDRLREDHPNPGDVQIVDAQGRTASATSNTTRMWKGGRSHRNFAVGGSLLAGDNVLSEMARAFEAFAGPRDALLAELHPIWVEGDFYDRMSLGDRLMAALVAGVEAGGNAQGETSATLIVARANPPPESTGRDYVHLRIDHSHNAVQDLNNAFFRWKSITAQAPGFRVVEQSRGADVAWLQTRLRELGYLTSDQRTVFDETGEPRGVFDDATAAAVARYKTDRMLGGSPSAGLETVNALKRELERRHPRN